MTGQRTAPMGRSRWVAAGGGRELRMGCLLFEPGEEKHGARQE